MDMSSLEVRGDDLVTADRLMSTLQGRNPLMLPLAPGSRAIVDYTVLSFTFPLPESDRVPKESVSIRGLARALQGHEDDIKDGEEWTYEWFYLELLAGDGKLMPRCWATEDYLWEIGIREREVDARGGRLDADVALANRWRYRRKEAVARGGVVEQYDGPWLELLELREAMEEDKRPLARLQFRLVPLYHRNAQKALFRYVLGELYETSIFNPIANPDQDRAVWRYRRRRYWLDFRRWNDRQRRMTDRQKLVRETLAAGGSLTDAARAIVEAGLHPINHTREPPADLLSSARRTVCQVKGELIKRGQLPEGTKSIRRPGRPTKAERPEG